MRGVRKISEEQLADLCSCVSMTLSLRYRAEITHHYFPELK